MRKDWDRLPTLEECLDQVKEGFEADEIVQRMIKFMGIDTVGSIEDMAKFVFYTMRVVNERDGLERTLQGLNGRGIYELAKEMIYRMSQRGGRKFAVMIVQTAVDMIDEDLRKSTIAQA